MDSAVNIKEAAEHILGRLRAEREHAPTGIEMRPQLGESEPDGGRTRVAKTVGVDEYLRLLDPEKGSEQLCHAPIGLMRDDMINGLDTDPKCARSLGSAIEQFRSASSHGSEVVLEFDRSSFGKSAVRAAGDECESGSAAETDLTEEIIRDACAGSRVVGSNDDRRSAVAHHYEIYQLAHVFIGALRVKVNGPSLGADNCDSFDARHGDEPLCDHERVRKAGACLTQFHVRSGKANTVCDKRDIRWDEAGRAGRMANKIRDVARTQSRFF